MPWAPVPESGGLQARAKTAPFSPLAPGSEECPLPAPELWAHLASRPHPSGSV